MTFVNGEQEDFHAIIFATGYKCTTKNWFKVNPNTTRKQTNCDRSQCFFPDIYYIYITLLVHACVYQENYFLDETGMPLQKFPHHWKGKNGVYCAGFSQKGLAGVSFDAQLIADDIANKLNDT